MPADGLKYLCFSADTSPDLARARFGERFGGAAPEKVYVQAGMLWAGPAASQESETMSTYVPFEKWSRVLPEYAHLYTAKEKASIRRNGGHVPQAPDAPDIDKDKQTKHHYRNADKAEYARQYSAWLDTDQNTAPPDRPAGLSVMGAQAVQLDMAARLKRGATQGNPKCPVCHWGLAATDWNDHVERNGIEYCSESCADADKDTAYGPQEPPHDPRIYNKRGPGGTYPPVGRFFDQAAGQAPLFDDTACLPLFSKTPVPGRLEVFDPPASQVQAKLPGFELKLKGE